jgi:DNA-directed RNA polymerase sigma subunit (sigma70/sigma32)
MRPPRYGELMAQDNPEAYRIWHTRHEEPQAVVIELDEVECQPIDELVDAKRIFESLGDFMSRRDQYILVCRHVLEMTYAEIAKTLDLSVERVRQLDAWALRRARLALEESEPV